MAEILLTGHRGYLGACVAQALRRAGLAFDPLPGRLEEIGANALPHTLVLHCAGALRHRLDRLDSANAQGMRHLLAGLAHRARVIFVSSRAVYAPTDRPIIDERAELGPRGDAYGSSKLDAERALMSSRHDWLILRPTTLFGWGGRWMGSRLAWVRRGAPPRG